MDDRIPTRPGRMLLTPENGAAPFYATLERADQPTQAGTQLNKNSLLKDATAALYGLTDSAVPDDIFKALSNQFSRLVRVEITTSCDWVAPTGIVNNKVFVLCHGGGGGGGGGDGDGAGGGGAGGYVSMQWVTVSPGTAYPVVIGAGGAGSDYVHFNNAGGAGGTTSFGSLVSAAGGGGGGAGGTTAGAGGSGGSGGGGGRWANDTTSKTSGRGGNGGTYGGGGGGALNGGGSSSRAGQGGNGGKYGGGGGGAGGDKGSSSVGGSGGEYGGDGAKGHVNDVDDYVVAAENGTILQTTLFTILGKAPAGYEGVGGSPISVNAYGGGGDGGYGGYGGITPTTGGIGAGGGGCYNGNGGAGGPGIVVLVYFKETEDDILSL